MINGKKKECATRHEAIYEAEALLEGPLFKFFSKGDFPGDTPGLQFQWTNLCRRAEPPLCQKSQRF